MPDRTYNLAIETSSRHGSVTLGGGDELLETIELPEQQRHAVELMPAIEKLFQAHTAKPAQLGEIYVSIGPGSFTGLRVGLTTAKVLAHVTGARLVAVPTLEVVVHNAPADRPHVAVMLNAKRGQCFTGLFQRENGAWKPLIAPSLLSPEQLLERAPRPLAIIGDHLPPQEWPGEVQLLGSALATPRSEVVWRLGRQLAAAGRFADPASLTPLYVRLPEAEELWQARHA
jgi:tRNA threonylcarbamoyladenosine biosynthesis protein TsaB